MTDRKEVSSKIELDLSDQCVLVPVELGEQDQDRLIKLYQLERLVVNDRSYGLFEGRVDLIEKNGRYRMILDAPSSSKKDITVNLDINSLVGAYQKKLKQS